MVTIYYTFLSSNNHNYLLRNFLPKFSPSFQNRILSYRKWEDSQSSLLGRLLLKKGMEIKNLSFFKSKIKYTSFNKPYFENGIIQFNISHSENMVVCALSTNFKIGIDIEKMRDINFNQFRYQMLSNEWDNIQSSSDPKSAFFLYWTQKEAAVKAHGSGFSIDFKSFEIINNRTKILSEKFILKEIKVSNNYKCHVALEDRVHKPIVLDPQFIHFEA